MTLLNINPTLTDHLAEALCNTLVHSLWQGILLAALAGLIIVCTKKASSVLRYNLLIGAMLVFTLGTLVTFCLQFNQAQQAAESYNATAVQVNTTASPVVNYAPAEAGSGNIMTLIAAYLTTYHNSIVLIWFLMICAKSIQLGVGLHGIYRLRRFEVFEVEQHWAVRIKYLKEELRIWQGVDLLESGLAKVPMVIGHLKPLILIPAGLLTALSPNEVEAILIHELAHIKRRDYLVNLLQSFVEILFFFNPAVLWISQLIKTERENCCDDMVLAQSSNKINYIRALVSCQEYQASVPAFAMGLPGNKNTLVHRVKRLVSNHNHSLNLFEKTLLAAGLVISGLCFSAFKEKETIKRTVQAVVSALQHANLNHTEQSKIAAQTTLLKNQTSLIRKNTAIVYNYAPVAGRPDTIKLKSNHPLNIHLDSLNITVPVQNISVSPTISLNVMPKVNVHLDPIKVNMAALNVHLEPLNISSTLVDSILTNVHVNVSNIINNTLSDLVIDDDSPNSTSALAESGLKKPLVPKISHPLHVPKNQAAVLVARQPLKPMAPKLSDDHSIADIGDELLAEHLITDKNNFTVKLNNDELIVNGQKQPEATHQLILKKHQKKADDKVSINLSYSNRVN